MCCAQIFHFSPRVLKWYYFFGSHKKISNLSFCCSDTFSKLSLFFKPLFSLKDDVLFNFTVLSHCCKKNLYFLSWWFWTNHNLCATNVRKLTVMCHKLKSINVCLKISFSETDREVFVKEKLNWLFYYIKT